MNFRITIARPPLSADFEVGSIAEAISVLEQEQPALLGMFKVGDTLTAASAQEPETGTTDAAGEAGGGKPARKPRANKAAETAVAPAPIPVPGAAPTSPPDTSPGANGIPAFLDRTAAAPPPAAPPAPPVAAAPPPPPILPAAPPIAPPVPPTPPAGVLAPKVVAELEKRKALSADGGAGLVAWLADPRVGLVVPGSSYDEAVSSLLFIADDKIAQVAQQLGVAA